MKYIYETVIYDGALKNWRVLNLNTGTFYSLSYEDEEQAIHSIKNGEKRAGATVQYIPREKLLRLALKDEHSFDGDGWGSPKNGW